MARKKKHPAHVNHERWLISYADFITLLFAFFVVMFAVSKVDAKKVGRFEDSFSMASGINTKDRGYLPRIEDDGPPLVILAMPQAPDTTKEVGPVGPPVFPEELAQLQAILEQKKALEAAMSGVKIVRRGNELVLRLDATALFASGDDHVKAEAVVALGTIADQMRERTVQVRVEGHTDDQPIRTQRFRSNWDLSTARATSVVRELVNQGHIPASRIAAVGYAEFQPIAPNDTPENRAKNRRVDFVVSVTVTLPNEIPQGEPSVGPAVNQSSLTD